MSVSYHTIPASKSATYAGYVIVWVATNTGYVIVWVATNTGYVIVYVAVCTCMQFSSMPRIVAHAVQLYATYSSSCSSALCHV